MNREAERSMENRGQKRMEVVEELPADKRACNSLEIRPSTSGSSVQTQANGQISGTENLDADMDTSSSASPSSRSDGEPEKDSEYGSCDSDDAEPRQSILQEYQRRRSSGDHGKLKSLLSGLSEETDPSAQLSALTELCEVLSFCTEDSLSSLVADMLSPILVKLTKHEGNADIMLLALRAITYLCDVFPRSCAFLVRHDAVPALCQRLMAIDYLDVAEQCLQALEKISRDQPLACLNAGAIMAVLSFIDFFSTSVQRVAVSTVVNICRKLPSESHSPFMDAVPILCNLLQYEDRQMVENVAVCLTKIAEQASQSPAMLDELCRHGLIHQSTDLLNLNSRTTLSQPVYNGLIGLLGKLSSGSIVAFRTLYELDIGCKLKEILSTHDISHTMSSPHPPNARSNQVHEVLRLVNELLPASPVEKDNQLALDKESFLVNQPDLLQKFGADMLPVMIQVLNSGANVYVSYCCLSAIRKLICLSKSDILVELLRAANLSSVLAGVFSRKDYHVLMVALQIAEMLLEKYGGAFLTSFMKEGVFFAIEALITSEKEQQYPASGDSQGSADHSQKAFTREISRCLCQAFERSPSSSSQTCRIGKDSVYILAKHVKESFFVSEGFDSDKGLTDVLQNLKNSSVALTELEALPIDSRILQDEKFCSIWTKIMGRLNGKESVSTFEFIESGVVKSLANYLSNGLYHQMELAEGDDASDNLLVVGKRFGVLARLLWSSPDTLNGGSTSSVLIQKLQNALSSLENFPVILSHFLRHRNMFATVPDGRSTTYPCLRIHFLKAEGETYLRDYSQNYVTVDPFCSLDAVERYLWPKVNTGRTDSVKAKDRAVECQSPRLQAPGNSSEGEYPGRMEIDSVPSNARHTQGSQEEDPQHLPGSSNSSKIHKSVTSDEKNVSPRLSFYLQGHKLDRSLTVYQAILWQKRKSEGETINGTKLWTEVHTITYGRAATIGSSCESSSSLGPVRDLDRHEYLPFLSDLFTRKVSLHLDETSPTYDILFLLKSLECTNRFLFHLMSLERINAFAEGRLHNLDDLRVQVRPVPHTEFISSKLTEKLEQQVRDSVAVSIGGMPSWFNDLMTSCRFLFSFEVKSKYFRLAAFGSRDVRQHPQSPNGLISHGEGRSVSGSLPRRKFLASRERVLESAERMMELHGHHKVAIEVEYSEEVGTGLGPTLEFYALVSKEFQKQGLGMWRDDHSSLDRDTNEDTEMLSYPYGLFPRPWSATSSVSGAAVPPDVLQKFVLLGKVVAKAVQDARVLDLPFSKAFYKLILGQELTLHDINLFDPELCKTLLELHALVCRRKFLESPNCDCQPVKPEVCFRGTSVEDLCLEFALPGYVDYDLAPDDNMVNLNNLEDYIKAVVDATVHRGIQKQVEAFRSGFNQVFSIEHLWIFNVDELELLLCGERDFWNMNDVSDQIKFDHGYTASSPPVQNLLEILQEFDFGQRRAFLQFVTGAPRLPPGGLASLNPKLTIVRKHCSDASDTDLPSVMTCANYLKLPPYSSKEKMKEKLIYAITEGQGSFHLS